MDTEKLKDRLIANIHSSSIPASSNDIEKVIDQNVELSISSVLYSPDIYIPIFGFFIILMIAFFIKKIYFKNNNN